MLAFDNLLRKQPFHVLTIQTIADAALIHRSTFYAHFEDKYQLLQHFLTSTFDDEHFTFADLTKRPFATLAQLTNDHLQVIVSVQKNDSDFQTAMRQVLFQALNQLAPNPQSLKTYLLIGQIKAVWHWVIATNQPYDIYHAGSQLDQLLQNNLAHGN